MVSKTKNGYNKRRRLKSMTMASKGEMRKLGDPATLSGDQFDAVLSSLYFCGVILQHLWCSCIFVKTNNYDVQSVLVLEQNNSGVYIGISWKN